MDAILFIFGMALLLIWFTLSVEVGDTARRLNRSFGFWLFLALLFSPFLAAVFVHCLGMIPKEEKESKDGTVEGYMEKNKEL